MSKSNEVSSAVRATRENLAESPVTSEDSSSDSNRKYKLMKNIELEAAVKR